MKSQRLVVVLITLAIGLQLATLYRQRQGRLNGSGAVPTQEPVSNPPKNTHVDVSKMPFEGASSARVALIEFSDYQCPFCARHANSVEKDLQRLYIANGKVIHYFANNPLPMHKNARRLATAAICAGQQKQYWKMNSALFQLKPGSEDEIVSAASSIEIDLNAFKQCMTQEGSANDQIDRDMLVAKSVSLTGTPGFIVGVVEKDGSVLAKNVILGAQPLATFQKVLDESVMARKSAPHGILSADIVIDVARARNETQAILK